MNTNKTGNWQVSLNDPLKHVEGIEDIAQCIYIILATIPGSDPLRPDFGSDIAQYIDRPTGDVSPKVAYAVKTAIERWEKRITVERVSVSVGVATVTLTIDCIMIGNNELITITVTL